MTIYPLEYKRDRNCNTPEYWNIAWRRMMNVTSKSARVGDRVNAILGGLPVADVHEYGFGKLHFARLVGTERWRGFDFCPRSVKLATEHGFNASLSRCSDAVNPGEAYVVGIEIIEHLDINEMMTFLDTVSPARHAFFSVPIQRDRDLTFPQHMRGFGAPEDLEKFLRGWWPSVKVETVRPYWRMAHCRRDA